MTTLHSGQEAASCTVRLYMATAMIPILFTCLWALVIPPVPLGMMAATVSAVLSARQTGKGDRVSLSLYGTAAWLANILVSGSQYGFKMPKRRENSSPFGAPFKCSDGRWFMPQVVVFNRDTPFSITFLVQTI